MVRPLKFGLVTPVVSLVPGQCSPWEVEGGPDDLRRIATTADALGYHHLTCSEHVGIPTEVAKARGPRFYDQLSTFGFMAAITERIRFLTHIVVLPYHHPLAVAKRYGTLDRLSGGRLILGVGVGTLKEEFELLGADFQDRGPRYEDALAALRASLGKQMPSYEGSHFRFDDFIIDPCAIQERVPIWLGGRTPRSLRRALALGDGWDPFGLTLDELGSLLRDARESVAWKRRTLPFDVALGLERMIDLTEPGQIDTMIDLVARTEAAGATVVNVTLRARSLSHYLEELELFMRTVAPRFNTGQSTAK